MWWIIYYEDGSIFSSADGEPWRAPPFGIQVIHQHCLSTGQERIARCDWYVWRPTANRWFGIDTIDGLWRDLWRQTEPITVRSGTRIDVESFNAISTLAHGNCRYGEKRRKPPWEPD